MKKVLAGLLSVSLFVFLGCNLLNSSGDDGEDETLTAEGLDSYAYSGSSSPTIIEVPGTSAGFSISGLSYGKTIWLTKTNPTDDEISASSTRYVSKASGISLDSGNVSASSGGSIIDWITGGLLGDESSGECLSVKLNANLALDTVISPSRSVAFGSEPSASVTPITPSENSTTKQIYVDTNSSMSTYDQKSATLRKIGTYCYVWVVDDYYRSTKGGKYVDSTVAANIAEKFDLLYPKIRRVFGNESDQIINGSSLGSMSDYSDTGTKVNIVIYDIGNDYTTSSRGGTVGYFYAKDYYARSDSYNDVRSKSNSGKYFYIDSYFAANQLSMVYSTLAHEFQHMVDYGVKTMATFTNTKLLQSTAWYNEMKSMLCEDIMKNYIKANVSGFTDEDSPFGRLPMFCRHYYDVGLEWNTTGSYNTYYSYANNYAFGAWAARNYGGVEFINRIATNSYVDYNSITAASGVSMTEMLKNYAAACVVNSSGYGFRKSITQSAISSGEYNFPIDEVNLWALDEVTPKIYENLIKQSSSGISDYYSFKGPVYFGYNAQQSIRPYGIMISKVGTARSSTVNIKFNTNRINSSQKVYLIIE